MTNNATRIATIVAISEHRRYRIPEKSKNVVRLLKTKEYNQVTYWGLRFYDNNQRLHDTFEVTLQMSNTFLHCQRTLDICTTIAPALEVKHKNSIKKRPVKASLSSLLMIYAVVDILSSTRFFNVSPVKSVTIYFLRYIYIKRLILTVFTRLHTSLSPCYLKELIFYHKQIFYNHFLSPFITLID